jgi:hypothetical protein
MSARRTSFDRFRSGQDVGAFHGLDRLAGGGDDAHRRWLAVGQCRREQRGKSRFGESHLCPARCPVEGFRLDARRGIRYHSRGRTISQRMGRRAQEER